MCRSQIGGLAAWGGPKLATGPADLGFGVCAQTRPSCRRHPRRVAYHAADGLAALQRIKARRHQPLQTPGLSCRTDGVRGRTQRLKRVDLLLLLLCGRDELLERSLRALAAQPYMVL